MNSKTLTVILCAVFAVVSVVFIALSIGNFTKSESESPAESPEAAGYVINGEVNYDAPAQSIDAVISNNEKVAAYPNGILEKMKALYAINKDTVGFLSIPGTEISTVVVQSDDNSYYLTKDFYKRTTYETSSTNYGNIYLDYRCANDGISKNTVIHGHTTGRASGVPKQSFRELYDYRDKNYFIKNPIIKYTTLYDEYTYKVCAVFLSTTQRKDDNGYMFNYIYPDMSDNNMVGYIEQVKQRMLYETGVSLEPSDKIITLSTCIYDYGKSIDTRLVVVGRLLHEGESEAIDATLVKDNPDYRRPQVWYNSHGKTNPYKDAARWEPSPE